MKQTNPLVEELLEHRYVINILLEDEKAREVFTKLTPGEIAQVYTPASAKGTSGETITQWGKINPLRTQFLSSVKKYKEERKKRQAKEKGIPYTQDSTEIKNIDLSNNEDAEAAYEAIYNTPGFADALSEDEYKQLTSLNKIPGLSGMLAGSNYQYKYSSMPLVITKGGVRYNPETGKTEEVFKPLSAEESEKIASKKIPGYGDVEGPPTPLADLDPETKQALYAKFITPAYKSYRDAGFMGQLGTEVGEVLTNPGELKGQVGQAVLTGGVLKLISALGPAAKWAAPAIVQKLDKTPLGKQILKLAGSKAVQTVAPAGKYILPGALAAYGAESVAQGLEAEVEPIQVAGEKPGERSFVLPASTGAKTAAELAVQTALVGGGLKALEAPGRERTAISPGPQPARMVKTSRVERVPTGEVTTSTEKIRVFEETLADGSKQYFYIGNFGGKVYIPAEQVEFEAPVGKTSKPASMTGAVRSAGTLKGEATLDLPKDTGLESIKQVVKELPSSPSPEKQPVETYLAGREVVPAKLKGYVRPTQAKSFSDLPIEERAQLRNWMDWFRLGGSENEPVIPEGFRSTAEQLKINRQREIEAALSKLGGGERGRYPSLERAQIRTPEFNELVKAFMTGVVSTAVVTAEPSVRPAAMGAIGDIAGTAVRAAETQAEPVSAGTFSRISRHPVFADTTIETSRLERVPTTPTPSGSVGKGAVDISRNIGKVTAASTVVSDVTKQMISKDVKGKVDQLINQQQVDVQKQQDVTDETNQQAKQAQKDATKNVNNKTKERSGKTNEATPPLVPFYKSSGDNRGGGGEDRVSVDDIDINLIKSRLGSGSLTGFYRLS